MNELFGYIFVPFSTSMQYCTMNECNWEIEFNFVILPLLYHFIQLFVWNILCAKKGKNEKKKKKLTFDQTWF